MFSSYCFCFSLVTLCSSVCAGPAEVVWPWSDCSRFCTVFRSTSTGWKDSTSSRLASDAPDCNTEGTATSEQAGSGGTLQLQDTNNAEFYKNLKERNRQMYESTIHSRNYEAEQLIIKDKTNDSQTDSKFGFLQSFGKRRGKS